MKTIAVIGSGITGISASYYLTRLGFQVSLFEAGNYFGGHSNTVDITIENKTFPVDTGFLVHNNQTYPNLIRFFKELETSTFASDMSLSVVRASENLIWAGSDLSTLFAQRWNLLRPKFYRFIYDILRFNRKSVEYLKKCRENIEITLGDLLEKERYSHQFANWYLLPMGASIWSTPVDRMKEFPAATFLTFSLNHGLLQVFNRPQWKTVEGGSRKYVEKALNLIENKYLNEPIHRIYQKDGRPTLVSSDREESFDACFLCSHPPDSIPIVEDMDHETKTLLSKFKYQVNHAILHTDETLLPPMKRAYSSWNYYSGTEKDGHSPVSVHYLINMLQPLPTEVPVILSLNPVRKIQKESILKELKYSHPTFDKEAIGAQKNIHKIQGRGNIFYSGAWMRYGFHEDGIRSSKIVINQFLEKIGRTSSKIEIYEEPL